MRPETYTIELPLKITYNKKGDVFYLNLNQYRNTHFHTLNSVKVLFGEMVKERIAHLPKISKLEITYTLFIGSKRLADLSNICSIVDKFFCDTLTNNNIIPDDNISIITDIHYHFGSVDKNNPRVEATLHNIIFEEEEPMRVVLVQSEIEDALTIYVKNHMPMLTGAVTIDFKAGRGEEGFTAEVNFQLTQPNVNMTGINQGNASSVTHSESSGGSKPVDLPFDAEPTNKAPEVATATTAVGIENAIQAAKDASIVSAPTNIDTPKSLFANLTKPTNEG